MVKQRFTDIGRLAEHIDEILSSGKDLAEIVTIQDLSKRQAQILSNALERRYNGKYLVEITANIKDDKREDYSLVARRN